MNEQKQRIAIAEASPNVWSERGWHWSKSGYLYHRVGMLCADPLNDLNAMHEVEKTLEYPESGKYLNILEATIKLSEEWCRIDPHTAPANIRAEAFLRTIGKWEE